MTGAGGGGGTRVVVVEVGAPVPLSEDAEVVPFPELDPPLPVVSVATLHELSTNANTTSAKTSGAAPGR